MTTRRSTLFALALLLLLARPASAADGADPDVRLTFRGPAAELLQDGPWLRHLRGVIAATLDIRTTTAGTERRLSLHCDDLRYRDLELGRVDVTVRTRPDAVASELTVAIAGPSGSLDARLELSLEYEPEMHRVRWAPGPVRGEVVAQKLNVEALSALVGGPPLGGGADLQATVAGTTDAPALAVEMTSTDLLWHGRSLGPVEVGLKHRDGRSTATLRWGPAETPHLTARAELGVDLDLRGPTAVWRDDDAHAITVQAARLTPAQLGPITPLPHGVDFALALELRSEGALDALKAQGSVRGWYAPSRDADHIPVEGTIEAGTNAQRAALSLGEKLATLEVTTGLPLVGLRHGTARPESAPLDGALGVDIPLDVLRPWLSGELYDPEGNLAGSLDVSGTLGAPNLTGKLGLEDVDVTLLSLHRRLVGITAELTFDGDELRAELLEASGEPGELRGSGTLRFAATPAARTPEEGLWSQWRAEGEGELAFDGFPAIRPGLPLATATGAMTWRLDAEPGSTALSVAVGATEVNVTEEEMPAARPVPGNRAVRITDGRGTRPDGESLLAGAGRLAFTLELTAPLRVRGPYVDLELGGRMELVREDDVARVEGGLDVLAGGHFSLFENRFDIRAGQLTLAEGWLGRGTEASVDSRPGEGEAEPLDVAIEIVARTHASDTDVLVKLHGPADRPALVLASVPALPEYQIMTLLITGRVDTKDERDGNVRRKVAEMVERYHNPSLERQLYDRMGVDKLGLGFGSSVKNPIVTVGRQITRELYVETVYHYDAPPDENEREGHVEYRIGRHWTIDTVFGDAAEGSLGVFWGTSFGGPPPHQPPAEEWGLGDAARRRADDDGDGIANAFDHCRREAEDLDGAADTDGCPDPDNDRDGIPDAEDGAPDEAETLNGFQDSDGVPDDAPQRLGALTATVRPLHFAPGSARFDADYRPVLTSVRVALDTFPELRVEVAGHSDDVGGKARRLLVSRRRATSVERALRRAGVARDLVDAAGYGFQHPVSREPTEAAREENRRVGIRLSVPAPAAP